MAPRKPGSKADLKNKARAAGDKRPNRGRGGGEAGGQGPSMAQGPAPGPAQGSVQGPLAPTSPHQQQQSLRQTPPQQQPTKQKSPQQKPPQPKTPQQLSGSGGQDFGPLLGSPNSPSPTRPSPTTRAPSSMTPSALVVPMLGQQPPVHFTGMTQPHNWPVFNPGSSGYTRSSRELRQTDFPNNVMPVQGGPPVRDTWGRYWWTPGNGGFFGWTHRSNGMRLFLPADLPDNQMDNRGVPGLGYRSHQDYLHWHPPSTQRSPPHASRGLPLTTPQPPLSTPQGLSIFGSATPTRPLSGLKTGKLSRADNPTPTSALKTVQELESSVKKLRKPTVTFEESSKMFSHLLGSSGGELAEDQSMIRLTFTHPTRFVHPLGPGHLRPLKLVILSRETGDHLNMWAVLLESLVYAVRYIGAVFGHVFDTIVVIHMKQQDSQHSLPDYPQALAAVKWGPLLEFLDNLNPHTQIHFLVRGWDALSTARCGLQAFLNRWSTQRLLRFTFIYFQRRHFTSPSIANTFGPWWAPGGNFVALANALHPGDQQYIQAAILGANMTIQFEAAMSARVHPPFGCQLYLQLCHRVPGTQQQRDRQPAFQLLYAKEQINQGKANNNALFYNYGRNAFA